MKPIAFLVWFYQGFQPMSTVIALLNIAMIFNLWMSNKGFDLSAWTIPVIGVVLVFWCILLGFLQHHYHIQQKNVSYGNNEQNAEIRNINMKIDAIAKHLELEK